MDRFTSLSPLDVVDYVLGLFADMTPWQLMMLALTCYIAVRLTQVLAALTGGLTPLQRLATRHNWRSHPGPSGAYMRTSARQPLDPELLRNNQSQPHSGSLQGINVDEQIERRSAAWASRNRGND